MFCSSDVRGRPVSKTFIHYSEAPPAVRRARSWSPPRARSAVGPENLFDLPSSTNGLGGARDMHANYGAAVPRETDGASAPLPRPLPMEKG
eukprot:6692564-Pyramimonas_sp.AAC.1